MDRGKKDLESSDKDTKRERRKRWTQDKRNGHSKLLNWKRKIEKLDSWNKLDWSKDKKWKEIQLQGGLKIGGLMYG